MRSLLFVPGDRPERFAKAVGSGADAVIFDLEDAVTAAGRPRARQDIVEFLQHGARSVPLWVRINPIDTEDSALDLAAIVPARPDGVILPKARSGADLEHLDRLLAGIEAEHQFADGSIKVIALITECAQAVLNAATFARAPARVTGYSWGAEDLAADIGASANRSDDGEFEFTYRLARASCLLAAAAAGVAAVDTTDIEFRDVAAVERRARASRRDGFVAKLAIHPAQIAPIHTAFSPSAAEIEWARRVVAVLESSPGQGAVALDGKMIDRPHLKQAQRILNGCDQK